MKNTNGLETIKNEQTIFLNYFKTKFPLFHNSNVFYRDLEYSVKRFLENKQQPVSSNDAEVITKELGKHFENEGIFVKVNDIGWRLNYPGFVTTAPGDPL